MHRWRAERRSQPGAQAVGAVLAARLALAEVLALHDELLGLVEHARIAVGGRRGADDERALGQQPPEALDLVAGDPRRVEHRGRVAQRLEVRRRTSRRSASTSSSCAGMGQQQEPQVRERAGQRLVVGLEQRRDDVVGGGRPALEVEPGDRRQHVVARLGAARVEERTDVRRELVHGPPPRLLGDRIAVHAAVHRRVALGEPGHVVGRQGERRGDETDGEGHREHRR